MTSATPKAPRTNPLVLSAGVIVTVQERLFPLEALENFSCAGEPDVKERGSMGRINRLPGG